MAWAKRGLPVVAALLVFFGSVLVRLPTGRQGIERSHTHSPDETRVLRFIADARNALGGSAVVTLPRAIAKRHDNTPLRMHVMTCRNLTMLDYTTTLSQLGVVFTDKVEEADVIARCLMLCDPYDRAHKLCRESVCRPINNTKELLLPPSFRTRSKLGPLAREEGALEQWEPVHPRAIASKAMLCRLVNQVRQRTGFEIAPPCFDWPAERDQFHTQAFQHPYWVYKPSRMASGKGQMFLKAQDILDGKFDGEGLIQAYMHRPFLYDQSKEPSGRRVKIKTDIRIYATMTSVEPLRVYIAKRGYFRSGHPHYDFSMTEVDGGDIDHLRHFINNGPKIRAKVFDKACAYEHGFGSAGTLDKYWELLRREGVDPDFVWNNIVRMFEQLLAAHARDLIPLCAPQQDCHQRFVDFFSDVIVLEDGQVRLLETHPSNGLKNRQRSSRYVKHAEMEGGFDPLVTTEVRQATWSLKLLTMAHFIDPDFRRVVERWIDQHAANAPALTPSQHDLLVTMAMESRLLCVLRMEPLFGTTVQKDAHWRDSLQLSNATLEMHALFRQYDLHTLTNWFGSGGHRCSDVYAWEL